MDVRGLLSAETEDRDTDDGNENCENGYHPEPRPLLRLFQEVVEESADEVGWRGIGCPFEPLLPGNFRIEHLLSELRNKLFIISNDDVVKVNVWAHCPELDPDRADRFELFKRLRLKVVWIFDETGCPFALVVGVADSGTDPFTLILKLQLEDDGIQK